MLTIANAIPAAAIKLVVFDLDGTLIDSRRDLAISVNAMLEEMGRPVLPENVVAEYVGDGAGMLVRRVLGDPDDEAVIAEGVERFLKCYREHMLDYTYVYDGVFAGLEALRMVRPGISGRERNPSAAKAASETSAVTDGLKAVPFKKSKHPSGAKAPLDSQLSSARLKSCPDTESPNAQLKSCADTEPPNAQPKSRSDTKLPGSSGWAESCSSSGERKFAILTNKPINPARRICEALGLSRYFFQIYGGNSFGTKKPDPEGLRALMCEAGVGPGETLMIGDSVVDVLTARNAKTFVIGCRYGLSSHTLETVVSDGMVDAPSEWALALRAWGHR